MNFPLWSLCLCTLRYSEWKLRRTELTKSLEIMCQNYYILIPPPLFFLHRNSRSKVDMIWNHADRNNIPCKPADLWAIISRCRTNSTFLCVLDLGSRRQLPFWKFTLPGKITQGRRFRSLTASSQQYGSSSEKAWVCFFPILYFSRD